MPKTLDAEVFAFRESSLQMLTELVAEAKLIGMATLSAAIHNHAEAGFPEISPTLARLWAATMRRRARFTQFGMSDWDTTASIPGLDVFAQAYWFLLNVDPDAFLRAYAGRRQRVTWAEGADLGAGVPGAGRTRGGAPRERRRKGGKVAAWSDGSAASHSSARRAGRGVARHRKAFGELRAAAA
jgi:hypothetical protein